jgi:hypothetical protein
LVFKSFDIERTWWRLFQNHVVHTKLDIYNFIIFIRRWICHSNRKTCKTLLSNKSVTTSMHVNGIISYGDIFETYVSFSSSNCSPFRCTWVHPPVFSGIRVTRSLVLCVWFVDRCLSFCPFSFGHYVPIILRFTNSYHLFLGNY